MHILTPQPLFQLQQLKPGYHLDRMVQYLCYNQKNLLLPSLAWFSGRVEGQTGEFSASGQARGS
jgi:hypothetical protein